MIASPLEVIISLRNVYINQLVNIPFVKAFYFVNGVADNLVRQKILAADKLSVF